MRGLLTLDIGGSAVKHGLFTGDGAPVDGFGGSFAIDGDADAETLIRILTEGVAGLRDAADAAGYAVSAVGVSVPGPFDWAQGVFWMRHKYAALYGYSLRGLLQGICPEAEIAFLHDPAAFLLGEAYDGACRGAASPAGLTLGTGVGFACMRQGRVRLTGDGYPVLSLWSRPFRGGIVEDFVSTRGIRARYRARAASEPDATVARIAELAKAGDAAALETMSETGALLAEAVVPYVGEVGCGCLVLGGRIALSAGLLLPQMRAGLDIPVLPAAHIGDAALRGLCQLLLRGRGAVVEVAQRLYMP